MTHCPINGNHAQFARTLEALEARQLFAAGAPSASFLHYVTGDADFRTFAIVYDGPADVDRATLGRNDVRVTGPGGFDASARFLGVARAKPGQAAVARYRVSGLSLGGEYDIRIRAQAVADADQQFVEPGSVGGFRIGRRGRTVPHGPLGSAIVAPVPAVQVLGIDYSQVGQSPAIDTSFGTVVQAINFGGGATDRIGSTGVNVHFGDGQLADGTSPFTFFGGPVTISMASAGGSDLSNATVGIVSVFNTEIYTASNADQFLKVAGLDPAKRYHVQYLHGDGRVGQYPYYNGDQTFELPTGQSTTAPLTFNTNTLDANCNILVEVAGTTSVTCRMPPSPTRGPSFSGVVISVADGGGGGEVTPQPPPPPVPPPATARFIRGSIRLVGSGQTFDVAYDNDAEPVTAASVAAVDLLVTGPRGFAADAVVVGFAPGAPGEPTIITYRVEGVDATSRYSIAANGEHLANTTLFHLRPVVWELTDQDPASVSRRRRRR